MNNYSQADMAFKKLIDSMKQNGSVFTSADAMVEEFNNILAQHGADDEDLVCIPLSRYEELLRTKRDLIGQLNEAEAKSSAEQARLERSAADCAQTLAELRAILDRLESCRIPELSDSDFHPALNEALRTFENGRIELIRATALPPEHAAGTAVQTAAKTDLADIPAGTLFRKGAAFFLPLILTILFSAFFLALSFIIAWKVAL